MALRIKVSSPDSQPVLRTIEKPELVIGRKPTNDLVLAGMDVSGTHASLQVLDGRVTLADLGSLNGTFVNGERIDAVELSPTDEVMISFYRLSVALVEPTPVPSPPNPAPPRSTDEPPPNVHLSAPVAPPALVVHDPPPPIRRATATTLDDLPPPLRRSSATPPDDLPPPIRRSSAAQPSDDAPPPIRDNATPPDEPPPPIHRSSAPPDSDFPPLLERPPRPDSPLPGFVGAAPTSGPADLVQALADPTIRRIVCIGRRIEVERDGVRLPLADAPASVDALHAELSTLLGRPLPRDAPFACVLADGTGLQTAPLAEHGLFAVITRPPAKTRASLDGLVHDQALPSSAVELLSACVRARIPVLLAGLGGASVAPLLTALLSATAGPTYLVRGLPTPIPLPRHCIAFDASVDGKAMTAQVRLALATGPAWLAVDEPDTAALDECAWGVAAGHGVLIGVRAESLRHALERARLAGLGCPAPGIPYALVALLEHSGETAVRTSFRLRQLFEVQNDGSGTANTHEILTTDRRNEFITTSVPILLNTLRTRGFHVGTELFTPS